MAEVIEDRIQESSTSTGTGNITLAGAVTAHRTFASVCAIGDTFYGMIVAVNANGAPTGQWEAGHYTYSAANTISRTSVNANSLNTTALVSFSAGSKRVYLDVTAAQVKLFQTTAASSSVTPYGLSPSLFTSTIFQEEFNGSSLNSTVWNKALYGLTDDPLQNFSVAAGNLNIWPDTGFVDRYIDTDGKFYLNPGCFVEFEAKMPIGKGVNANCWLTVHDTAVHTGIDLGKTYSGGNVTVNPTTVAPGYADTSYHPINFRLMASDDTSLGPTSTIKATDFVTVPDLSLAYHKYGMKWEASGVTFYFDGVQVGSKVSTTGINQRMYIVLSVSFGSGADAADTTNTPRGVSNSFQVNYVRAWQLA